ncbi:MAG TPA: hypothetical protein ENN17_12420 [bacterium]|nr:hypothetical protein [bacterium]
MESIKKRDGLSAGLRSGSRTLRRIAVILLLGCMALLSRTHRADAVLNRAGLGRLAESNTAYLDQSLKKSLGTFGVLSAVKVGLAVVKGTEIGVGFGIQIGDVVQSAYDFVDLAWRAVLASAAILLGTQFLLKTAALAGHVFLTAVWILIILGKITGWLLPAYKTLKRILKDACLVAVILAAALYVVIPLSVAGGRLLSVQITKPVLDPAEENLVRLRADLFPDKTQEKEPLLTKLKQTREQIARITEYLTQKSVDLSLWILRIVAGYLFDSLVFPLLFFLFLMWLTRTGVSYLFQLSGESALRKDLEEIAFRLTGYLKHRERLSPSSPEKCRPVPHEEE